MKHSKKPFICQGCGTELESSITPHDYRDCYIASARAIMQRFVDKVDSGLARSKETYGEMKEWLDE